VCTWLAASRKKKVNSSGLGWAGLLRGEEERRGWRELGRGREKGKEAQTNSVITHFRKDLELNFE
jgi:hypothetical protein